MREKEEDCENKIIESLYIGWDYLFYALSFSNVTREKVEEKVPKADFEAFI